MEAKLHRPKKKREKVGFEFLQMVSGKQEPLCPSFPKLADRSFQLSSIKFPERQRETLERLTAEALRILRSQVTDTAVSDPSDLRPDSKSEAGKKKVPLNSVENEKEGHLH